MQAFANSLFSLSLELAPWLLLGLAVAGLMKALLPMRWVVKLIGKPGWRGGLNASLLGAPLPLCSCSVMPVAVQIRRQGASKGATAGFLVSTPQNGVDSVMVTYAMLGPVVAVAKVVTGIVSGFIAALTVGWRETDAQIEPPAAMDSSEKPCCSSGQRDGDQSAGVSLTSMVVQPEAAPAPTQPVEPSRWVQARSGLQYAFTTLLRDLLLWLTVGLVLAAAVDAWVPEAWLSAIGGGWWGVPVMLLVGIPMYICSTSSVPLAAALLAGGVTPGAVLVFLIAGPATNLGTFGIVRQELGTREALVFLITVCVCAVGMGYATDALLAAVNWSVTASIQTHQHEHVSPVALLSLIVLAALSAWVLAKPWLTRLGLFKAVEPRAAEAS